MGIEIGKYLNNNELPESILIDLVGDALARGLLVVNEFNDTRINASIFNSYIKDVVYDGPSPDAARGIELSYNLNQGSLPTGNKSGEGNRVYWPTLPDESSGIPIPTFRDFISNQCFPAGTLITLHDGSQKAIENICKPSASKGAGRQTSSCQRATSRGNGDTVLSFDSNQEAWKAAA